MCVCVKENHKHDIFTQNSVDRFDGLELNRTEVAIKWYAYDANTILFKRIHTYVCVCVCMHENNKHDPRWCCHLHVCACFKNFACFLFLFVHHALSYVMCPKLYIFEYPISFYFSFLGCYCEYRWHSKIEINNKKKNKKHGRAYSL